MGRVKKASAVNNFYSGNTSTLRLQIEDFFLHNRNLYKYKTRAVIVPHAGLMYSGRLALEGINQLDKDIKNLFIIAPSHKYTFEGLSLSSCDEWETPLGNIKLNREIIDELNNGELIKYNDMAFENEHSVEVQIPIIQFAFKDVRIIPILTGQVSYEIIKDIISKYYPDKNNGFIISSDLSHHLSIVAAKNVDLKTAQMIESGRINNFTNEHACGATGIKALVEYSNINNYSIIRIDMANSSEVSGDISNVVGYGCWFLYEGEKNDFIKEFYPNFTIQLCHIILDSAFSKLRIQANYPQVFDELGASFVTLEKSNKLRGCVGSIEANKSLINDIVENTKKAAFNDSRFSPVTQDELKSIKINISILSEPQKINFNSENDLLEKITPFKDGIIIKDGNHQAVYLPCVWEQLSDRKDFLNSLKIKAGLDENYFSNTIEAYKFKTVYIKE